MKKTVLISTIALLTLSACGKGETPPEEKDKCSSTVAEMLLAAEFHLNVFKAVGIKAGKNLTESHRILKDVRKNHSYFSCEGIDHETGVLVLANTDYVSEYEQKTYDLLIQSIADCRFYEQRSPEENKGCSIMESYFRDVFRL